MEKMFFEKCAPDTGSRPLFKFQQINIQPMHSRISFEKKIF